MNINLNYTINYNENLGKDVISSVVITGDKSRLVSTIVRVGDTYFVDTFDSDIDTDFVKGDAGTLEETLNSVFEFMGLLPEEF